MAAVHTYIVPGQTLVEPVTVAELKIRLAMLQTHTSNDNDLRIIISQNRSRLEAYLHRSIVTKSYVTVADGPMPAMALVQNLIAFTQLKTVTYFGTETVLTEGTDFHVRKCGSASVEFSSDFDFPDGLKEIRAYYTAGMCEVDPRVKSAIMEMCISSYQRTVDDPLTDGIKAMVGGMQVVNL